MSEIERNNPPTTTISTIAIQSGNTRIVIALLQSKTVLELKLLELVPDLTLLGETFEEASELEIAHNHVLQQLQNKQSPVEELLKKADQVIADQKPQAEVYAAMADSLGQAWKDINAHLLLRKHILHLNVAYHSKAEACVERMKALEMLCLSPIPSSEEMVKENLAYLQEVKKSMLECLMAALKSGQSLLASLNGILSDDSLDSRPNHYKRAARSAVAQVERWLEELHNRRRLLDVTWQRRKLNLEKHRTLSILKCDLELLESLLRERYELLSRVRNELGDSASSAQFLLEQHQQLIPEATNLQEEGLRMLKASERLPSSSHKFSEESNKMSYNVLNLANEYLQAVNDREDLLKRAIQFFNSVKSVMMKLEEMNYQLKNVNNSSERLIIMNMIDDITKNIINDGHYILERAPGAKNIKRALEEIENFRLHLISNCTKENEGNYEISQLINIFYEKNNQIFSWLVTVIESTLQSHRDMGNTFAVAQNYLQHHQKLYDELLNKNVDLNEMAQIIPPQMHKRLSQNTRDDVTNKLKAITNHYLYLKKILEDRIKLCQKYVEFHSLAASVVHELDLFTKSLSTVQSKDVIRFVETSWMKIKQIHEKLVYAAEDFLFDLSQTQDSYLDAKRAQLCVETVLEHFANRKSDIEAKLNFWKRNEFDKKSSKSLWTKNMVDSENTIDWVVKLESQLYPVLNSDTVDTDLEVEQVNDKLSNIIPEIKRAQQEIELRIKTAKELIAEGNLENNEEVPPKLNELHDSICSIVVEYSILVDMFASFLKNVKKLEKRIKDLKATKDLLTEPSIQQLNDVRVKHLTSCKSFHDLWNVAYSESQSLMEKIKEQEPEKYAERDVETMTSLLENTKLEWESLSVNIEQSLKRWQILKQFDQDLENINASIKELSEELSSLQHQYRQSLSAAKSSSLAFQYFEKTIQVLEVKIESFINTAGEVLEVSESKSTEIENQLDELKDRWNKFCAQVSETRRMIDLSIQYFTLIEETEECFRDGTKLLVCVARKSSTARTAEDAENLLREIQTFQSSAQTKQEERIKCISELVPQLFRDDLEHSRQISQVVAENGDMLESFSTVSKELSVLQQKLKTSPIPHEPIDESITSTEIVSVEKLPSALGAEKVEVVQVTEETKSVSQEVRTQTPASPSSPPFKKTKFFDQSNEFQKPVFVTPLNHAEVPEGSRFTFECEVKGYPTPEITWLKEGLPVDTNPDYKTGFQDGVCSLTIEEVFVEDSATFVCLATNEAGTAETTATLSVTDNESEDKLLPPSFVILPTDAIIPEHQNHEFYCKVTGNPLPVVQWYRDDVCIESMPNYEITFNNGDARLLIKDVTPDDSSTYTCSAVNPLGSEAMSAKLVVKGTDSNTEPPSFTTCLSNVMARAGQKLKLECAVNGRPFPNLSWLHNGKPLKEQPNIIISVDDTGDVVLIILEAFPKDAGTYTLVASNAAGEVSCSCNVSVKGLLPCETSDSEIPSDAEPVRPSIKSPLSDVTVKDGAEALLECVIVGQPEPEVIWYRNEVPVKESDNIRLLFRGDKCSLYVKESSAEDDGVYKVVAINSAGETSSTCRLRITDAAKHIYNIKPSEEYTAPKFTKLLTDVLVREGDAAILECAVSGHPEPEVKWFLNKTEIIFSNRIKCERSGDGNITLTVNNAVPEDKGLYTARAVNSVGEAKCFSHVIVKSLTSRETKSSDVHLEDKFEHPSFVELFTDQIVYEGAPAKFECIVRGKPAPKVRWLFNNEAVSGKSFLVSTSGDRQVLSIPEVSEDTNGIITCVAENEAGKNSCVARLRVIPGVTTDSLAPTLDSSMNVFESSKSYAVKKSTIKKSTAFNDEPPVSETDSFTAISERASEKFNDLEPVKVESHQLERHHEMNGKLSDYSSQSFSFGNLDLQNKIQAGKQCSITALKPARKQTAPRFLSTIDGAIVDVGRNVHFEAIVESYPAADIVWYKNNEELSIQPGKMKITWELNRATLEIFDVDSGDAGRYTCSASNDVGTASCSADLFVKKTAFPPVMGRRLHPQSVPVGHRVTFEVEVTGTPSPTVMWFKDDAPLAKVSPFYRLREQGNSFALIIEKSRFEDCGQYKAKASNEAGEAVSIATLHVFEPPKNVTDGCQISQDSVDGTFIENQTIPNKYDTNTTKLSELSSNYSSEFSKKIEISKTNKHISFNVDGQKFEDDFSVKKNEYEYRNLGSGDGAKSISTAEEFVHKANDQPVYENKSHSSNKYNFNPSGTSTEIEELQKPIIYSNTLNSYSSNASNLNKEIYLEPGPPPELGYIPKEAAVLQKREPVAERVKKLENCTRELSPVEIPAGAVKIFPTIIPKSSKDCKNSHLQKKYSSCMKEYKNTIQRSTSTEEKSHSETVSSSTVQQSPNIKVSEMERCKSSTDYNAAPIYRPPAEVELRPLSPRPSAEGVGMERLWTQKKQSEESSTFIRPITPYSHMSGEEKVFKVTDIKRSLSPLPSADGVAMDKLWAHPIHLDKRNRPHSVIGGVTDNVTSDSEISRSHVEKTWAPVGTGNAKSSYTARHIYEDVHKVNDQVVSETKFDETVTNKDGAKSIQRSVSEEKKPKKFKWPPQDVRIEDSLVRKGVHRPGSPDIYGSTGFDQQYCRTEQAIHKNVEQTPQKYYQAVRSVPYPASKSVSYEKQEFCSNQTLPRSFKFASSSDSKFKPVKPYSPGSIKTRPDSDYESDFEVTKISKQAYGSESNEYSSSSTYSVKKDGSRISDKFIANKAVFSKGEPPKKTFDSGYTADTDEPIYLKGSTFVPKSPYPRVAFSPSTYQNYSEQNKTHTFPRISENKISNSFIDDTATSRRSTSFAPVPSPSKFIKSDIRESDYESDFDTRIPPIWRPSDSEPDEPTYRPVRPILQSSVAPRPQYYRTASADAAISTKFSDTKANFKPVSPAVEYCTSVKIKPSPTFNDQFTKYQSNSSSTVKDRQYSRSYSGGGDSSAARNDVQKQSWPKGGYDGNYEERCSKAEYVDQSSFTEYHSEVKKVQKVEEIRKRFETKSSSFSGDLPVTHGDAESLSRSRFLTDNFTTSKQFTDVNHSSQFKPQQFIDNIVNSVSSRQHELKQGAMKSPSLYSSSLIKDHEPRVFKDHYSNSERMSSNEGGWVSDISRSTEAEYVMINGGTDSHAPHTVPVFTTPLHDIAAVIGSLARFECIVQTESPFNVEWRRNGEVVRDSELCQLSYRNGVCKLTLLKTYMYDAGTYQCIVTNRAGSAETSATLIVSGERRSYIKK